jgi:hypothetical protein
MHVRCFVSLDLSINFSPCQDVCNITCLIVYKIFLDYFICHLSTLTRTSISVRGKNLNPAVLVEVMNCENSSFMNLCRIGFPYYL